LVNSAAESDGWLVKLSKPSDAQLEHLMQRDAYQQQLEEEDA
jgi:glycine cleavage system H lipoate-binding protein